MYMFLGDSHSRQFVGITWGIIIHHVFSRATMKGLISPESVTGHGKIIRHALTVPTEKIVFLMFGGVDLDFSFHREVCRDLVIDLDEFFGARTEACRQFVDDIFEDRQAAPFIRHFCILGPQISPLRGDGFIRQTSIQAGVAEDRLREACDIFDFSHEARNRRVVEFNDRLEATFANRDRISFCRIDKEMVDVNFAIKDVFAHPNPLEHHAATWETVQVWRPLLSNYMDLLRPQFEHE